jgi:hypothetical protein
MTLTVAGRHSIFKRYYIDADVKADWNLRIQKMRKDRNKIAHGEEALSHSFQAFLQLHYDVFRAIRHLSNEIRLMQAINL